MKCVFRGGSWYSDEAKFVICVSRSLVAVGFKLDILGLRWATMKCVVRGGSCGSVQAEWVLCVSRDEDDAWAAYFVLGTRWRR